MKRLTQIFVFIAVLVGTVGLASAASAYWSAIGTGTGSASAGTLGAPAILTHSSTAAGAVSLSWSGVASPGDVPVSYYVLRNGSPAGTACGSATSPLSTTSCSDTVGTSGDYSYTVTAVFRSWSTISSAVSVPVVLDTTPPAASSMSVACAFVIGSTYWCSGTYATATGDLSSSLSVTIYNASTNALVVAATAPSIISGSNWIRMGNGLAKGTYYARLTQSDTAGNTTTIQSSNFTRS